jgi:ParB family transcriptional regulator, chromosome partitioning protein
VADRRGMGRGLAAILPETATATAELRELPVALIKPNPAQPRKRFDPDTLAGLAASIEATGVVQPLLVRPLPDGSYELVAGERRWRAAQQAGLDRVPAIVRDAAEADALQTALIENVVREDLNPVDEARACATLVEDLGVSKQELGRRIGRSRPAVSNLIRLLELPDDVLALLESGELSEGHGRALLQVKGTDARRQLAHGAATAAWSVRETEKRARLASQPGRRRRSVRLDPEAETAMREAADRLEAALGYDVRIRPRSEGVVVEIRVEDLAEVEALAARLGLHRAP